MFVSFWNWTWGWLLNQVTRRRWGREKPMITTRKQWYRVHVSCLLGEQPGEENSSGVPLISVLNTKNEIHLSRVLQKNINLACQDKLFSHGTEIVKTTQGKCASSQNYNLTCHPLPPKNCFLDHEKQLLGLRLSGSPSHSYSDHVTICLALRASGTWYKRLPLQVTLRLILSHTQPSLALLFPPDNE